MCACVCWLNHGFMLCAVCVFVCLCNWLCACLSKRSTGCLLVLTGCLFVCARSLACVILVCVMFVCGYVRLCAGLNWLFVLYVASCV